MVRLRNLPTSSSTARISCSFIAYLEINRSFPLLRSLALKLVSSGCCWSRGVCISNNNYWIPHNWISAILAIMLHDESDFVSGSHSQVRNGVTGGDIELRNNLSPSF